MDIQEPIKKREFETVLPMINIVFLLLIFFMLAGAFTKPDMFPVVVPEANIENDANRNDITILMNEKKQYAIDKKMYSNTELTVFIKEAVDKKKAVTVQLKADQQVTSDDLINTMEMLGSTGLQSIRLMTVMNSQNPR